MKMIKSLLLLTVAASVLTACSKVTHRKTPGGMPYELFKGKGGEEIKSGDIIKISVTQKIKDSIYFTTAGKMPVYFPVGQSQSYDISETWTKLRVGDSIVAVQMMDTFIRRSPTSVPPEFKNGDRITTYVKVLGVFKNDSLAQLDKKNMEAGFLAKEIEVVEKYLADKKITAQKTPSGTFVEVINPGTGELLTKGKYVSVNYTGRTFAGVTFDSNTDTSFHHVGPYAFTIGNGEMIKGFDEAMFLLRNGSTGRIYIPSLLAYGERPNSPLIKPFEHLIFDIAVVKVEDKAPPPPPAHPGMAPNIDMPQQK